MKLFENGVGRPSNEIKKKRKIFIVSAIVICIAMVSVLAFALTKVSTGSLKGAAIYETKDVQLKFNITNAWWNGPASKYKNFNINVTDTSRAYDYIAVSCKSLADCKADNAWDRANKQHSGNTTSRTIISKGSNKTGKIYHTDYNKLPGTTFYLRVTTYDYSSRWLAVDVYEVKVKDGKRKCGAGYCYPVSKTRKWGKINKTYVADKTTTTSSKLDENAANLDFKITNAWWNGPASKYKSFNINVTNTSKAYDYIAVSCKSLADCKASNAWDIANKQHSGNTTSRTIISKGSNKTGKIYHTDYNKLPGTTFYLRVTTYDYSYRWLVADVYQVKVNDGKRTCGTGYCYPVTTTWKWSTVNSKYVNKAKTSDHYVKSPSGTVKTQNKDTSNKANSSKLVLTCPDSSIVNEAFKCSVDQTGVKIVVGGANSLAKGYSSKFTTTINDLNKDIKYTSKLFDNYKSIIKKDKNGRQYINAKVTASKSGYKSVTKYVKIYKTNLPITLSCPSSAKVGEAVKCTVNQTGVKITLGGANSLASGYNSTFTTTSNDLTKDIKYTSALFTNYKSIIKKDGKGKEYINAKVKASKSGCTSVTKYIKIYR